MKQVVRSSKGDKDGSVALKFFELFDGELILFDGPIDEVKRIIINFSLFSGLPHFLFSLFKLNKQKVTSW